MDVEKPTLLLPRPGGVDLETDEPGGAGAQCGWKNGRARKLCIGLLVLAALAFQITYFSRTFAAPWTSYLDFNGAVWAQAGHNFATYGVRETLGVPAPFYYGSPPVPAEEYYSHHPSLLPLMVMGAFKIFGEHEWAARLVPVGCSVASLLVLWLLVAGYEGEEWTAAFSAAVFAFLPMELCWGQMVNFEPCTLLWMLTGLLGFRRWQVSAKARDAIFMMGGFTLAMLTSWVGYIFVLVLCAYFLVFARRRYGRLVCLLLAMAVLTFSLFLLQNRLAQPDSFDDMMDSFWFRTGQSNGAQTFTLWEWAGRVGISLVRHFPPVFLALAAVGGVAMWRDKAGRGKFGIGWICGCFIVTNGIYDVVFRNASFVHDYASFYFVAAVAVMAGKGLDVLARRVPGIHPRLREPWVHAGIPLLLLAVLAFTGYTTAGQLQPQALILSYDKPEPRDLIPDLGKLIHSEFSRDTLVLVDFDKDFNPQLCYYAQENFANGLSDPDEWGDYLSDKEDKLGAVVWMGDENADAILALLKTGSKKMVSVQGVRFCVWKE